MKIKLYIYVKFIIIQGKNIKLWFLNYWETLIKFTLKKNIISFYKTILRVAYIKRHQILVLSNIRKNWIFFIKIFKNKYIYII